jgi:hypothetical protein
VVVEIKIPEILTPFSMMKFSGIFISTTTLPIFMKYFFYVNNIIDKTFEIFSDFYGTLDSHSRRHSRLSRVMLLLGMKKHYEKSEKIPEVLLTYM